MRNASHQLSNFDHLKSQIIFRDESKIRDKKERLSKFIKKHYGF